MKKVQFITDDGVTIVGNWFPVANAPSAVLLLHMMPATKESWTAFASQLNQRGFSALAIDLRGHGESTSSDHQASIHDVDSAMTWLSDHGYPSERVMLVGASIGANLALEETVKTPAIPRVVLVSPGLNYRGIKTEPLLQTLPEATNVFLIASKGDRESFTAVASLQKIRSSALSTLVDGSAHGTAIFDEEPEQTAIIIRWLIGEQ